MSSNVKLYFITYVDATSRSKFTSVIQSIPQNNNTMFKSYLKTTLRTIRRSPLTSFINIFGLAMALGVAIMVYAFVDLDLTTDQFHTNRKEIYMATSILDRNGVEQEHGITPAPYAEKLKNDFPQIEQVVRVERRSGILKAGLKVFNEQFTFADPEYLDMFTFPLKYGNESALYEANKIILSENTAIKYFGDTNPIGEAMTFDFGAKKYTFEVAGVAEKFPYKSSMTFKVLVNFDQLRQVDPDFSTTDWSTFLDGLFIRVKNEEDIVSITNNTKPYVALQNEVQKDWPARAFGFMPWTKVFIEGEQIESAITGEADPLARLILSIIGIFILLLAVFNYINIAIVSATKRLKEIGVRKVMGGTRRSLITQFLTENIFMTLLALVLGLILSVTVLIPGFDNMFDIGIEFEVFQPELWIFLLALSIFTGLTSGAYPALYISNFNAINIFRGRLKFGGKNRLTKAFLTLQYILAIITVVGGILFTLNTNYQKERDWGYNESQTIGANINNSQELKQLMAVMQQKPSIKSIAASKHHIGRWQGNTIIETLERKIDVPTLEIGSNYIETMGLNLKEGRDFTQNSEADFSNVIINELLAKTLNPAGALGERFKIDSLSFTVIGIVEDFHQWSFYDKMEPMLLRLAPEREYSYLSMQVETGSLNSSYKELEAEWAALFPETPFNGFYQESTFEWYFRGIEGHGKLMRYVAILAVLLSCLGLYGLVSLNVASRVKEFSIRKALGANLKHLIYIINKKFITFLIVALALGLPLSYFLMETMLDAVYAYHVPITVLPFVIAFLAVVLMVILTVSSQIKKVMTVSPTEGLRSE
uniref:ABC transporter permease n=4 Tax=Roseivirga sp. TaxID=1964215 RepID=UPI004047A08A